MPAADIRLTVAIHSVDGDERPVKVAAVLGDNRPPSGRPQAAAAAAADC